MKHLDKKILTYNKYDNIVSQKTGFTTATLNSASTLTNDFYAYKHLIAQYTDNSQIDNYFGLLENDAKEIRNNVVTFVFDCSNEIKDTLNIISKGMRDSWYEIRKDINPYLYETLDEVFTEKLRNLNDLSENKNITEDYKSKPLIVELVNSNREILGTIDFDINVVEQKFGYSLKRLNDHDLTMDVYVKAALDLTATTSVNNKIAEIMSRRLASGKVGVSANYILHDKSVDIDAYANLDEVNYTVAVEAMKSMEDWQEIYKTEKHIPALKHNLKRKYRRVKYEF